MLVEFRVRFRLSEACRSPSSLQLLDKARYPIHVAGTIRRVLDTVYGSLNPVRVADALEIGCDLAVVVPDQRIAVSTAQKSSVERKCFERSVPLVNGVIDDIVASIAHGIAVRCGPAD